jgi:Fe-S cluster assembly protein SufD
LKNFSKEQFESWMKNRQEPTWFTDQRRQALEIFHKTLYPDRGTEAWRRLPWDKILFENYSPSTDVKEFIPQNAEELKRQGVILVSLQEALRLHSDLLKQHWSKVIRPDEGKFEALAAAFTTHGAFLYIPSMELREPIVLRWEGRISGETIFPHLVIVTEANSHAAVILERHSSNEEKPGMVYGVIETLAGKDSHLDILSIQQYGRNVDSFVTQRVKLEQGAQVQTILLGLGSRVAHTKTESILAGSGASAELLGFFFGEESQHFSAHTLQNHQAPHTQSDLLFKSALRDHAQSAYYGLIQIQKGAQATNAYQANRNLLL